MTTITTKAMRAAKALLAACLGGLLLAGSALAHADYLRSEPGDEAVVASPPARVDIWFTQELFRREGENTIEVIGPDGSSVHVGEAQIDDDDRKHMWVALRPHLESGNYTVIWHTLSAEDGDTEAGMFTFTFDPGAVITSTPMSEATDTPTPTSFSATPTQPPAAAEWTGCWLGLVPALAIVLLTGVPFARLHKGR